MPFTHYPASQNYTCFNHMHVWIGASGVSRTYCACTLHILSVSACVYIPLIGEGGGGGGLYEDESTEEEEEEEEEGTGEGLIEVRVLW